MNEQCKLKECTWIKIIIIITLQKLDQTDLFFDGIIGNQTKILLIIGRTNKWKIIKKVLT
jgi:hypothetical protein